MTDLGRRPPVSRWVWPVVGAVVFLLLASVGRYGVFRDEFYYLMCADHPAWGYVDHPPLAMVFLTVWTTIFGDSELALRIPPALLVGLIAAGGGLLAREMRGGAAAQVLATITVGLLPGILGLGSFYSMNAFDVAFWVLVAWIVCRLLDPAADRRWWYLLGVTVGLGLLNKYSVVFLGVGLVIGLLLSPLRCEMLRRRALIAVAIAVLITLPHLIWQVINGWPTLEFMRNAHDLKNVAMSPADFWGEQVLMAHPLYLPLWIVGVLALILARSLRPWRPLGVAFVVVGLWLTIQHAKPYYLVPAYPMILAAGAVAIIRWLSRWRRISRVMPVVLPVVCVLAGLVIAPLAVPLLAPADYVAYEQALGLRPKNMENSEVGALPQHFADRFGWSELSATVHEVLDGLSDQERANCLIVAGNYGECGAINYHGLPEDVRPAVSGHNSCHTWWPVDFVPDVVLVVGSSREQAEHTFHSVELGAVSRHELAMPYEQQIPVWVCRGFKVDPAVAREAARFLI